MYIEISELPETMNINNDSVFPLVFEGVTKKVTFNSLKNVLNYFTSVSYNKTTGQFIFTKTSGAEALLSTDLQTSIKDVSIENGKITFVRHSGEEIEIDVSIADGSITAEKLSQELQNKIDKIDELEEENELLHSWLDQTTDTAEGEGTEITLENTLELPLKNITGEGNSEQESTEGKQLFNINDLSNSGIISNRTSSTSGTSFTITRISGRFANTIELPTTLQAGTTIYVSATLSNNTLTKSVNIQFGTTGQFTTQQAKEINNSITLSNDMKYYRLFLDNSEGTGNSADVSNLQIEIGSSATNWEQYTGGIPAPNPSYPFPIKNVTGDNNVVVRGKNLFDKNNANILDDIYVNVTQMQLRASTGTKTAYIEIQGGETYTITKIVSKRFGVGTTSVLPASGVSLINGINDNSATSITIETDTTAKYLCVFYLYPGDTSTEQDILNSIQIETGSTATTYEPYVTPQTKPLNLGSLELNKIGDYQDYIYKNNGNWYKHNAVRKLERAIADMDNTEDYPGWRYQTQLANDFPTLNGALYDETDYLLNIGIDGHTYGTSCIFVNLTGTYKAMWLNKSKFNLTQTQWKETYPNLVVKCYYGIPSDKQDDTQITDTTLISQLEEIDKMQSYNGTTIITSTFDSNNAQMILSVSGYKNKVTDARLNDIEARLALLEE